MFAPASSPTPDMILMQDLLNLRSFITNYSLRRAAGPRRIGEDMQEQREKSIESRAQTTGEDRTQAWGEAAVL